MDIPSVLTTNGFDDLQRKHLQSLIELNAPARWNSSQLSNPCDRAMVWQFTKPDDRAPHSYVLESVFRDGRVHHQDVYGRLEDLGYEVYREARKSTRWTVGKVTLSGRMDGALRGYRGIVFPKEAALEIKSCQGYAWDKYDTIEDVYNSDDWLHRGWGAQLLSYMVLEALDIGVLCLKSKATGLLKLIPATLDYERADAILKRIERLQEMVDRKEDPAPISWTPKECGRCGWQSSCYPAKDMGGGLQLLEDVVLYANIKKELELKPAASEYESVKKGNRTALKRLGKFEMAAIGDVVIVQKERPVKAFTVDARVDTIYTFKDNSPKSIEKLAKELD